MQASHPRDTQLDNIKGIMIFFVAFCHCIEIVLPNPLSNSFVKHLYSLVYSFHMPVFVFLSGYLTNPDSNNYEYKVISNCLIPYLIINTVYGAFYNGNLSPFYPQFALWYLFSLAVWRISIKYVRHIRMFLPIAVVVALAVGCFSVGTYLSLSRIICFFPYFFAGFLAKKSNTQLQNIIHKPIAILLFFASMVTVLILCSAKVDPRTYFLSLSYASLSQPVVTGVILRAFSFIAGSSAILLFFSIIPSKISFLSGYGEFSLPVYIFHIGMLLLAKKLSFTIDNQLLSILFSFAFAACSCFLFGNKYVYNVYTKAISFINRIALKSLD